MVHNLSRKKHQEFLDTNFSDLGDNLKNLWKYVKIKNNKGSNPSEVLNGNKKASEPLSKANMFNEYFDDSFNSHYGLTPNVVNFTNDILGRLRLTNEEVLNVLVKLYMNKVLAVIAYLLYFF